MPLYTFILDATATVEAESEEQARESLKSATLEEDIHFGSCGIYIPGNQIAELAEVYDPTKG